jgi:hypothetical protein
MRLGGAMDAGKKLKTWKEAAEILKAAEAEEKLGKHDSCSGNGSSMGSSSACAQHAAHRIMLACNEPSIIVVFVHHDCVLTQSIRLIASNGPVHV